MVIAITMTACAAVPSIDNNAIPANNSAETKTINNSEEIAKTAETLGTTEEKFNSFLSNINYTYDNFIATITANTTLEDYKADIEKSYNCKFSEYIDTILLTTNKIPPDENEYKIFRSNLSTFITYIPRKDLNDSNNTIKKYDIAIEVADECSDAYAFDAVFASNGNLEKYIDTLNQLYKCNTASFTNITLYGGYGIKKPQENNDCLNYLFVYDTDTNEILRPILVPVLTLQCDDPENNISLALSNELGLIFKTTGKNSYDKMLELSNIKFQIRTPDKTQTSVSSETTDQTTTADSAESGMDET